MKNFFPRWLARSLFGTFLKGALATAALAAVASLIFCLVSVTSGIKAQLGRELSAYGANIIILPKTTPLQFGLGSYRIGTLAPKADILISDLKKLTQGPVTQVEYYAPGLIANVKILDQDAGAAGYPFDVLQKLNPLWHVEPRWPHSSGEAMIGTLLANRLRLSVGNSVDVFIGDKSEKLRIAAIVETGGDEDKTIFIPLGTMQKLTGRSDVASLALVRVKTCCQPVDKTGAELNTKLKNAEARTVRQVAVAEESLLRKVSRLLWFVTLVVGAATAFTVAGTISVLLLARKHEIGLCLALGATPGQMRWLFICEAAFSGIAGGLAGCIIGAAAAAVVSKSVFDAAFQFNPMALLPAIAVPLFISVAASVWPVRKALGVSPCESLREQ